MQKSSENVKLKDIESMITLMGDTFVDFQNSMPKPPKLVELAFSCAFRFEDKSIYEAMLLKLARVQSTVRAGLVLLQNGYVQELGSLQRTVE